MKTKFKYLNADSEYQWDGVSRQVHPMKEIAYQLKRIADALEKRD